MSHTRIRKSYPMKKFTCIMLMMLIPLIGFAQEAKKDGPKKETINSYRIFPKDGHDAALKAALAAHAQKFHTGNWKWRVSEILSGPDMGAYMIVEGPNSWTDLDGRGDLGPDHQKDYDTNILPHVEKSKRSLRFIARPEGALPGSSFQVAVTCRFWESMAWITPLSSMLT